ncbi:hypothetical protein B2G71_13685 [Novosphingobium sp. PC22D]|uniref:3'-5' exonuclease n=1 Tax=Novosphingobium sp. PC22D TaxID=1962403 RepID=UPI000BF111E7|nr:hypothetical protein [Novosphingobium sp. PC22D]PEQ12182.1 hypothetical protein B2G71_13685 [Novosphingobium sp. PC22D]
MGEACPALIDFEASCLPEDGASYPIEVALALVDGTSRTWLIRPSEKWRFWTWSEEAERLHGISREMLEREGSPPEQVLREMAETAGCCTVYADADLDAYWLEVLADAAGHPAPFAVHYLGEYMLQQGWTRPQVVAALEEAKLHLPNEHVARDDASRLALTVKLLRDEAASRAT